MKQKSSNLTTAIAVAISCLLITTGPGGRSLAFSGGDGSAPEGLVPANTAFGLRLFRELARRDGDANLLISPVCLGTALALAFSGAAGETAREMAGLLTVDGMERAEVDAGYASLIAALPARGDGIRLDMANSLWADRDIGFNEGFLEGGRTCYRAPVKSLDLGRPEAADLINSWVDRETGGRIGPVVDTIDPEVVLYIVSAIYFRGGWSAPFDPSLTGLREFTLPDGTRREVPTMMASSGDGHYYDGEGFKAARLDYGDGRVSMYVFLPDEDSGLGEFYERLTPDNWTRWLSRFETGPAIVYLPRFSLEYDATLNDALVALGMERAFGDADFSRMTPARVFISTVKHASRLEVDEEGTEGASAATVALKKGGVLGLHFTRPFCFAIVDNATGAIIMMGSLLEP